MAKDSFKKMLQQAGLEHKIQKPGDMAKYLKDLQKKAEDSVQIPVLEVNNATIDGILDLLICKFSDMLIGGEPDGVSALDVVKGFMDRNSSALTAIILLGITKGFWTPEEFEVAVIAYHTEARMNGTRLITFEQHEKARQELIIRGLEDLYRKQGELEKLAAFRRMIESRRAKEGK